MGLVLISWLPREDFARVAVLWLSLLCVCVRRGRCSYDSRAPGAGLTNELIHHIRECSISCSDCVAIEERLKRVTRGVTFVTGGRAANIRYWRNLRPDHPTENCDVTTGVSEEPGLCWDGSHQPSHIYSDFIVTVLCRNTQKPAVILWRVYAFQQYPRYCINTIFFVVNLIYLISIMDNSQPTNAFSWL